MAPFALLLLSCLLANTITGNWGAPEYSHAVNFPKFPGNVVPLGPVNTSRLWSRQLHGLESAAAATLAPLFNYPFLLPRESLRAGLAYAGAARRLRKFTQDLLAGNRPLKIGVVGGSISAGASASKIGTSDWFSLVWTWLASATKAPVTRLNGCRHATPSAYMVFCLESSVQPDTDLVFVEYSLNDGFEDSIARNSIVKAKEQLIRRILRLPSRPAVVLVQVPHVWAYRVDAFFATTEDAEGALAAYYDVQSLSPRTSNWLLNLHKPTDGFQWNQTYYNRHPLDNGHKAIADLAVHLIQEVAIGLYTDPMTVEEMTWRQLPLPVPMHEGNYEPLVASCLVGDKFAPLAIRSDGWQWVNEGTDATPKWGYVATTPGSSLVLRLDTPRSGGALDIAAEINPNGTFAVLLHYLISYTSMGRAAVSCEGGCRCGTGTIDGVVGCCASVTKVFQVGVQWPERDKACDLRFVVLNETSSGGHKFKVSGIVFATSNGLTSSHPVDKWSARRVE